MEKNPGIILALCEYYASAWTLHIKISIYVQYANISFGRRCLFAESMIQLVGLTSVKILT